MDDLAEQLPEFVARLTRIEDRLRAWSILLRACLTW